MSLLTRLINPQGEETKLPVHQFMAALGEYKRGAVTLNQIAIAFDFSEPEKISLQEFLTNLDSNTINRGLIHDVLLLAEDGLYTTAQVKSRLGISSD